MVFTETKIDLGTGKGKLVNTKKSSRKTKAAYFIGGVIFAWFLNGVIAALGTITH